MKEKFAMRRVILGVMICTSLGWTAGAVAQQGQYSGVSQPPQDPIEITPDAAPVPAKPAAGVVAQPPAPMTPQPYSTDAAYPNPAYPNPAYPNQDKTPDSGQQSPTMRATPVDPDGDIVHPRQARPGELLEGATIRVRIIDRLSSTELEKGQQFRGQVASDVLQDGKVLIPAGSSIEGRVSNVSTGNHLGGHGSFRLKPESVTLPDGARYELHAYATGTPGSKTKMGSEGSINPGSRKKKDGIEYGAVVGTGAVTGAVLGGPIGALTGSLIGAGMVTTHILVDHPQATLEPGAVLLFTLTEPMNLTPPQTN
jgi:hypothetical protein